MDVLDKTIDEKRQGEALTIDAKPSNTKKLYLESYGCQMNFSDSEIVASILSKEGYKTTQQFENSDLILLNTCSIREKAEQTVRNRLRSFNDLKKKNLDFTMFQHYKQFIIFFFNLSWIHEF